MPVDQLAMVACAIIVSRILHALPSCGGFLSADLINKDWCFFRRLRRFGYINRTISVRDLLHNSDTQLFTKMCLPGHSLYHLLPPQRICTNLRSRGHNFQLPDYCFTLHKRSFVIRTLLCPRPWQGALSDDARLTSDVCLSDVCLSRTSGLSREQRGLGRLKLAKR